MKPDVILHLIGYPVAIAGILRLRSTFRNRRTAWFLAEEAGTAAIVAGWALKGTRPAGVVINSVWGIGLAIAWFVSGRRRRK